MRTVRSVILIAPQRGLCGQTIGTPGMILGASYWVLLICAGVARSQLVLGRHSTGCGKDDKAAKDGAVLQPAPQTCILHPHSSQVGLSGPWLDDGRRLSSTRDVRSGMKAHLHDIVTYGICLLIKQATTHRWFLASPHEASSSTAWQTMIIFDLACSLSPISQSGQQEVWTSHAHSHTTKLAQNHRGQPSFRDQTTDERMERQLNVD